MKPSITLGLLCMLFSEVAALICHYCYSTQTPQTCINVIDCGERNCVTLTSITYIHGMEMAAYYGRDCSSGNFSYDVSVNFGSYKIADRFKACSMDRCNFEPLPAFSTNPNGRKCYICEGQDCTKQLSCVGIEDQCATGVLSGDFGHNVTFKGCVSKDACTKLPAQLRVTSELSCCEGDLCNSATGVGQSVLLLLGPLLSVLLFH